MTTLIRSTALLLLALGCAAPPEDDRDRAPELKAEMLREQACESRDSRPNSSSREWNRPGCPGP